MAKGRKPRRKAKPAPETPTRQPLRLSVAMIVRDEARCLALALASVQGVADEVIVVDTGSTDETVAIATRAGATVLHHRWTDRYPAARNVSLAACQGAWIFVLDADEQLTPEGLATLTCLKEFTVTRPIRYQVKILNTMADNGAGTVEQFAERVFPRDPGLRYTGRIQERPGYEGLADDQVGLTRLPSVTVRHDGYRPEVMATEDAELGLLEQGWRDAGPGEPARPASRDPAGSRSRPQRPYPTTKRRSPLGPCQNRTCLWRARI